jgi:hypothetical protein
MIAPRSSFSGVAADAARRSAAQPAHRHLAGKQRDCGGDVGGAGIEAGEEQDGESDDGPAAGKGVLHPGPESGGA